MDETLKELGETIVGALGGAVSASPAVFCHLPLAARADDLRKVMPCLREDPSCQFVSFIDAAAADWPAREKRFDEVYHLLSPKLNRRVRVKVQADETTPVPSIVSVYPGADWFEREAYDLYGV